MGVLRLCIKENAYNAQHTHTAYRKKQIYKCPIRGLLQENLVKLAGGMRSSVSRVKTSGINSSNCHQSLLVLRI